MAEVGIGRTDGMLGTLISDNNNEMKSSLLIR
jgi:hypothetical protein